MARGMNALLYVGAILGGCLGTLLLFDALVSRTGQGAIVGIGAAVVPYVMARAWAGMRALDGEIPRSRVGDRRP